MNAKDAEIITMLRKDARVPLTMISKNTQIPISTLSDRIRTKVDNHIIRHTSLLDFDKLGYNVRVHMLIKAKGPDKAKLRNFLIQENCLNSMFAISNGHDFMVEGIFRHVKEMEEFIENMETNFSGVEVKQYFVIEDFKRESFTIKP